MHRGHLTPAANRASRISRTTFAMVAARSELMRATKASFAGRIHFGLGRPQFPRTERQPDPGAPPPAPPSVTRPTLHASPDGDGARRDLARMLGFRSAPPLPQGPGGERGGCDPAM